MVTDEVREYIKKVKDSGKSLDEIRDILSKKGWKAEDIDQAFVDLGYKKFNLTSQNTVSESSTNSSSSQESFFAKITTQDPKRYYPNITASIPTNPSRFWAVPVIGGLIKCLILLPVAIELILISLFVAILMLVNPFYVLINGKYLPFAYQWILKLMRLSVKFNFFLYGVTDKYPGFGFEISDSFSVSIPYPENPNKLFAIPLIGALIRLIFIIPFDIFLQVVYVASGISSIFSSFIVFFQGRFPETNYDLAVDYTRVYQSLAMYQYGISDTYPSFRLNMRHKKLKVFLLILGLIFIVWGNSARLHQQSSFYSRMKEENSTALSQTARINNIKRQADLTTLQSALIAYLTDEKGQVPRAITGDEQKISKSGSDLCSILVPKYISNLPVDPSINNGTPITDCESNYNTGYSITFNKAGSSTLESPHITISASLKEGGVIPTVYINMSIFTPSSITPSIGLPATTVYPSVSQNPGTYTPSSKLSPTPTKSGPTLVPGY